ncbi:MAG: hypothetical protein R3F34_16915 [Planctomycetota bacterium]
MSTSPTASHDDRTELELLLRIDRLESAHRRTRRMLALAGGALLVAVSASFVQSSTKTPPDAEFRIVRAAKYSLWDPRTEKVRGEFSYQTMEGGWAGITLWDLEGRPRAEFKLWEDGSAHLSMISEDRRLLQRIGVDANGAVLPELRRNGE